jgi:ubiquinone biosynthesis protein
MAKRILVATASGSAASGPVRWAADAAGRDTAELLLLRVIPADGDGASMKKPPSAVPDDQLTQAAHGLVGARGRGLTVTADDAADAIVHVAEHEHVDLIVCGNTGMRGRREFLLNNVPNRISHMAHCNVVLVNTEHATDEPNQPHFHHHRKPPVVPADPSMFEGKMLGRAAEIGRVIAALGVRELITARRTSDLVREAKLLRQSLEKLGPTFEKLGQMLSTRPDLLPPEFIAELSTLQDDVPPLSQAEAVTVMEQELHVPWEDVFLSIDAEPMAAGTIAQVHRAVLANGDRVVVKVQRPSAEEEMCKDLALLQLFGERAKGKPGFEQIIDLPAIIDHLSESLQRELDFTREGKSIESMRTVLEPFDRLAVPASYPEYSTHRLLIMEEVQGVPLLQAPPSDARSEAARQLVESYYQQVLTAGFFHADPHPGNLMWWNDKIYLLDFGMVGELDHQTRDLLSFLLLAFWHEDVPFLSDVIIMLAERHGHVDEEAFRADLADLVQRYRHLALEQFQLGPMLQDLTQLCVRHDIRMPSTLAFIGKALGQMQLVAAQLDPGIDPFAIAGRFFTRHLTTRVREMITPQRFMYNAQKLRFRVTSLVDSLERLTGARPGWEPTVTMHGTERMETAIRRAGRRIASAAIAAASFLVVGLTDSFGHVGDWVKVVFACIGGIFTLLLLLDLVVRR